MSELTRPKTPAEEASEKALAEVYGCLDRGESFLLEAGAGAGKTYTFVKALQFLLHRDQVKFQRKHQKIACITFTNVAKAEIESRTDRSPLIFCDTIHAFCWSLISGFQKQMRARIPDMEHWAEKIAEVGDLGNRIVEYALGHRSIKDDRVSIHHDDVLLLTEWLMNEPKFRLIVAGKYPIILIDEYQDTNAGWIESIKIHFLGKPSSPQFGFFGDHWQKIYGDGCGKLEHPSLIVIGKKANFRSAKIIVDSLNRMRPTLPQFVDNPNDQGSLCIYHSNKWTGERKTGQHWGGDLPDNIAESVLKTVYDRLTNDGWDLSAASTKILMLTHRVLAIKQGYGSLPGVFEFNDSFTKKEDIHIAFFADALEPACVAFLARKFGAMFEALSSHVPHIRAPADKEKWSSSMNRLLELRKTGTVGEVIDYLRTVQRPRLPEPVESREKERENFDQEAGQVMPRGLAELESLRNVPYKEIISLARYLAGHSPFETKHGVKGAQFENVLVVVGRGWNRYNFNEMLEFAQSPDQIPPNKREAYERNRNLFYVTCSRPKKRLAILFTQKLSEKAMRTLSTWFGAEAIEALLF